MPAKMLAAAARFRRANDPVAVTGNDEMRILLHRRAFRNDLALRTANRAMEIRDSAGRAIVSPPAASRFRQVCEPFFKFAAENCGYAEHAKIVNVHGGVQAVTTEMARVDFVSES